MQSFPENKFNKDGLARILSKPDFNFEKFVNTQSVNGGLDCLLELKENLHTLQNETNTSLKRNVYKNYSQFIETASEIKVLEKEMYQLSHMLNEQRNLMNSIMNCSITGANVENQDIVEEVNKKNNKNIAHLLEIVEDCSSITEVSDRYLVYDGDLLELNKETFLQVQKVHLFLLNDSLMVTTYLPQRRGPVKFAYQDLYEIDSLAVVNVRDDDLFKNVFKILMFPETRVFQIDTAKDKRHWLSIFDKTKMQKATIDKERKLEMAELAKEKRVLRELEDSNPFAECEKVQDVTAYDIELNSEWLQKAPEELDVFLAEREFNEAVLLVQKVWNYLESKGIPARDFKSRIDHRVKQLTELLMAELDTSAERSIRGGPRAARQSVSYLLSLRKSSQACHLFLRNHSNIIKYNIRQLKIEGATTSYIRRLCNTFYSNLIETGEQFEKAFPDNFQCFSAFIVWCKSEIEVFSQTFKIQVFQNKSCFTTVCECVYEARLNCDKLSNMGVDLLFVLDNLLSKDLSRQLSLNRANQLEAIRHRAMEDKWQPKVFKNSQDLKGFVSEMQLLGIRNTDNYSFDGKCTSITSNTHLFVVSYISYTQDLAKIYSNMYHKEIVDSFFLVLCAQLNHCKKSLTNHKFDEQHRFIVQNGQYLIECVLPLVREIHAKLVGEQFPDTERLQAMYADITAASKVTLGEFV